MIDELKKVIKRIQKHKMDFEKPPPFIAVSQQEFVELRKQTQPIIKE